MKARKTVSVEAIVDQVNASLKESTCSPDIRYGMCTVVEQVLMESGNYRGFRFLSQEELPNGLVKEDSRRQYFFAKS